MEALAAKGCEESVRELTAAIDRGTMDTGGAYVINSDSSDHQFFCYDGGDMFKLAAACEPNIPAKHHGFLSTKTAHRSIKVHVDKLGIAGSKEQCIEKGRIYEFDGVGFRMIKSL